MKLLFAWRYFISKKSTNVINIISWISVVAIAVGAAALIVVLSVFNGFQGLVRSLYGDFYADMRIAAKNSKVMTMTAQQIAAIKSVPGINTFSMTAEEKAVLVNGDFNTIIYLRGVDNSYPLVASVNKHITSGKYLLGTADDPAIVLGGGVENAIGANVISPEPLTIYLPNTDAMNFSDLKDAMYSFNIKDAGTFRIQEDFDNKYALTNLSFVKYMLNMDINQYTSMEVKLDPNVPVEKIQRELENLLGDKYDIKTRYEQNQSLFSAMQMEKWIIYAILSLILLIASFNMVGALTMLVLEKRKDISILKALGADNKLVNGIFLNEGLLLGLFGGFLGLLLAYGICYVQETYHVIKLAGGSFLIDYYPVKMKIGDFVLVALTIFAIAIVASYLPARKAASQDFSLKS